MHELGEEERELLSAGLSQWGGPAGATDEIARVIGYSNAEEFESARGDLTERIEAGSNLEDADWRRALVATEICFASDVHGAGVEWPTVTGLDDVASLAVLRRIQRKLV